MTLEAPCRLFRETSDTFFASRDATALFGQPVELAFVDGLHTFDQTFRDIANIARHCDSDSVVLVHDVFPVHAKMALRDRAMPFWTGDVWKIAPMITALMPEVEMLTIPTYPSGLMVLKNLAGSRDIDPERWRSLEAEMMATSFPENLQELAKSGKGAEALR